MKKGNIIFNHLVFIMLLEGVILLYYWQENTLNNIDTNSHVYVYVRILEITQIIENYIDCLIWIKCNISFISQTRHWHQSL
jgi:hypothetical protein